MVGAGRRSGPSRGAPVNGAQGGVPTAGQLRAQCPLLGDKDVKKTLLFRELEEVTMNHFSRQQRVCPTRCHKKEEEASFRVPLLGLMAENH